MLAALAGLAGLMMMRNPRKRRKAKRRNPRGWTWLMAKRRAAKREDARRRKAKRRNPSTDIRSGNPRACRAPDYLYHANTPQSARTLWCVCGTNYGYLHNTAGDIRTWATRSGAARAASRYASIHRNNPINTGDVNLATVIGMRGNPGKVYDPFTGKMVKTTPYKVKMGGPVKRRRGGKPGVKGPDGVWRQNPRRRKGRKVSPGAAAARLANWRWHHNPLREGCEGYEIPKGYKSRAGNRLGQEIRRGTNPVYAFDVALIVARQNGDHVAFKTLTADRKLLMQCKNLTEGERVAKTTARDLGYKGKF